MITYHEKNINGIYSCDELIITKEQWKGFLRNAKETTFGAIVDFLRLPEHKGSCNDASITYGKVYNSYIGTINTFGKNVSKELDIQVVNDKGEIPCWIVPMKSGWKNEDGFFVWQLRDELAEAAQELLMERLINKYVDYVNSKGSLENCDELYKWKLIHDCKDADIAETIKNIRSTNLIDGPRTGASLKALIEKEPIRLEAIINDLCYSNKPLNDKLKNFKNAFNSFWDDKQFGNTKPNDERTAATLLTCKDPENHTLYKSEMYEIFCGYLGIQSQSAGNKYKHYLGLLSKHVLPILKQHTDFLERLYAETDKYAHSDLLNAQDVLWQMQDIMKKEIGHKSYWAAGYSWGNAGDQSDRFIEEGIWEGSGISSVNSSIKSAKKGDIILLKSTYTKGADHKISALKIIAIGTILEPAKKEGDEFRLIVKYNKIQPIEFTDFKGSYRQTFQKIADSKLIEFADNNLEPVKDMKYKEYINLLKANKNLVLTGAPGTGKTYMAKEIAQEMGAETCFVQFHPSMDYTDFVEGLRAVKTESEAVFFERRDGVFKEFCKLALKNLEDSRKSTTELTQELSIEEMYNKVLERIENEELNSFQLKTSNKSMEIVKISDFNNIILTTPGSSSDRTYTVSLDRILKVAKTYPDMKSLESITNISDSIREVIGGCNASSYWAVLHEMYSQNTEVVSVINEVKEKPFVFIIDEINRGEISKIFGELFFSIDPGYAGEKGKVKTQYQNLVDSADPFAAGFYVPENVYIIATMNDIDRSVESMDFAIRRRFVWKEVTPAMSQEMLTDFSDEVWHDEAINRMNNLNKEISGDPVLGSAYQIGAAYFRKLDLYDGDFSKLWELHLEPLLKEYLRGIPKADEKLKDLETAYQNASAE